MHGPKGATVIPGPSPFEARVRSRLRVTGTGWSSPYGPLQSPQRNNAAGSLAAMALEFGIFDHVDRHDQPLSDFYEDRFRLIEAYDRASIYSYHCAEHHSTPLGMAPSPSVYLAAIGQRTRRLRFGPLVYTLALYHPLRLAEEI